MFTAVGGQARNYLARLNADGSLDTAFAIGTDDPVLALAVQADGKVVVGGMFTEFGSQTRNFIALLNADGSVDETFDPRANNAVAALALLPDGKLAIGGYFTTLAVQVRHRIARLNADGSRASALHVSTRMAALMPRSIPILCLPSIPRRCRSTARHRGGRTDLLIMVGRDELLSVDCFEDYNAASC